MKKQKLTFQSKDFDFPKTAYIACISARYLTGKKHYVFLTRIFEDLEVLRRYVLFVIDEFSKDTDELVPTYDGYFIEIKQNRLFKLQRKHWQNKKVFNTDIFHTFRNDVNIIKYWEMSEILVTPDGNIDGVDFYSFCLSVFKNTPEEQIDLFIQHSNQVVDTRAKNASFYSLSKPVKINWLGTGKKNYQFTNNVAKKYIN